MAGSKRKIVVSIDRLHLFRALISSIVLGTLFPSLYIYYIQYYQETGPMESLRKRTNNQIDIPHPKTQYLPLLQ